MGLNSAQIERANRVLLQHSNVLRVGLKRKLGSTQKVRTKHTSKTNLTFIRPAGAATKDEWAGWKAPKKTTGTVYGVRYQTIVGAMFDRGDSLDSIARMMISEYRWLLNGLVPIIPFISVTWIEPALKSSSKLPGCETKPPLFGNAVRIKSKPETRAIPCDKSTWIPLSPIKS